MYHLLYEKLKRDEKTAESKEDRDFSEKTMNLQNSLVQYEQAFDLLFMQDLIHLLMHTERVSKVWRPMNLSEQFGTLLISFAESFKKGVILDEYPLHHEEQQYVIWKAFTTETHEIIETWEFHGSKLLLPNKKRQIMRHSLRYGTSGDAIPNMFPIQMVL